MAQLERLVLNPAAARRAVGARLRQLGEDGRRDRRHVGDPHRRQLGLWAVGAQGLGPAPAAQADTGTTRPPAPTPALAVGVDRLLAAAPIAAMSQDPSFDRPKQAPAGERPYRSSSVQAITMVPLSAAM